MIEIEPRDEKEARRRRAVERVALLLDADLEPEERLRLQAEVDADAGLRRHVRELRAVWDLLDAYSGIEPSRGGSQPLIERARAERVRERKDRWVRVAFTWAAAAAIFLAVFLGLPGERRAGNNLAYGGQDVAGPDGVYARSFDWDFEDF